MKLFEAITKTIKICLKVLIGRIPLKQFLGQLKYGFYSTYGFPLHWNIYRDIHLELTSKCNLSCKACYRSGGLKSSMELSSDMDLIGLKKLLQKYDPQKVRNIILSGGENTLHPQFFEALKILRSYFPTSSIYLSTNGVYISRNKELLDKICTSSLDFLQFSLHGAKQSTIDLLQKGIDLAKVIDTIVYIKRHSSINICVNFVIQKENIDEIPLFLELMAKAKVNSVSLTPINYAGHTEKVIDYKTLWKDMGLKEKLTSAYKIAAKNKISIPPFNPRCTMNILTMDVITANGSMLTCCGNYLPRKYSVGNVFEQDLQQIRKQQSVKLLYNSLKKKKPLKLCVSCWANGLYDF
ncbi:radical SAM/SPASM domain-containing protein [Candidatus Margulisiibacteriota bacterium]